MMIQKDKQIPKGYKDSSLGIIPEDWEVKRLGEIAVKIGDGLHTTPKYVNLSKYYFINGNNLINGNIVLFEGTKCISKLEYISLKKDLDANTVLLSINGTIGNIAIYKNERVILGKSAAYIKFNSNVKYYYYLLQSDYISNYFNNELSGSTIKNLSLKSIRGALVLVPEVKEQKSIVNVLEACDKTIELQDKLVEALNKRKKALIQQLLTGKKHVLDFSISWEKVKLGNICNMSSGGTPKSTNTNYYGGEIPWVVISDITKSDKWLTFTEKTLTKKGLENSNAKIFPKNTVLYAMYASLGKTAIAGMELTTNQAILGIKPKENFLNYEYLYYFLNSQEEKVKTLGQSGTQSNLNKEMVMNFNIDLPSLPEQQAIAEVLSTADKEIELAKNKLESLKDQKRGLMQQLLTGKKRLRVD